MDLHREADRVLLTRFTPPGVLVNADLDILQYRGDTGSYLAPAPGKSSLSLLKMLREGLLVAVRAAVLRADQEQLPVREEGLRVKSDNGYREVAVEVIPLKGQGVKDGGFLILFEEDSSARSVAAGSRANFFNTPGAEQHAFPLYSLLDAERLRSRILQVFEDANREPSLLDEGALNFVIVGAGPTGVEMAGALADLIRDDFFN